MSENEIRTEIIRPFLESTLNVLKTMAFIDAKPGKPFLKKDQEPKGDVTGIIGMASATVSGSMALVFSEATILQIVSSMLSEKFTEVNQDVLDCVGELTNMISGGARAGLAKLNLRFEMAIPSMIQGRHHIVEHRTKGAIICIPFDLESGRFYIECTFKENN
jgi:chemotaxis protein CheX